MSAFWSALVASLISSGLAFTGVWISNRRNDRRHRETLREEAMKGQRDIVAATLLAGRDWALQQQVFAAVISRAPTQDFVEFVNSENGGKRLEQATKDLQVALTRGKLFLADDELRRGAISLSDAIANFDFLGPFVQGTRDPDAVRAVVREIAGFTASLQEFEDLAIERLPRPVWYNPEG